VACDLVVLSGYSGFLNTQQTDRHDMAEILLKVALNTITIIKQDPINTNKLMLEIQVMT
jgi:hypothetical protein